MLTKKTLRKIESFMKSNLNKRYGILVVFIVLGVTLLLLMLNPYKKMDTAQNGTIDLTGWNFQENGIIKLNGEWEFYWNQLLDDEGISKLEPSVQHAYFSVPNTWNRYEMNGKHLNREGYATYRLKVRVKNDRQIYSLKIQNMSSSYKLIIDGRVYAENGAVGENQLTARPEYKPITVSFQPSSDEFDIILQVSNFSYYRGGFWRPVYMGLENQTKHMNDWVVIKYLFACGCIFMIGLLYFVFFLATRNEIAVFYFSVLCMILLLNLMTNELGVLPRDVLPLNYNMKVFVYYMTYYWSMIVGEKFVEALYPKETSKMIIRIHIYIVLICTIITITAPPRIYTYLSIGFDYIFVSAEISSLIFLIKAIKHKREGALFTLVGILTVSAAMTHDILYENTIINSPFDNIMIYGVVMLTFMFSLVLSKRFYAVLVRSEEMSKQLLVKDREKDEFLTNISHELKTPVNSMIAVTESVLNEAEGSINSQQKEVLSLVVESGKRLSGLIKDLLDFSKMKNGILPLQKSFFDIECLIQNIVKEFLFIANEKNLAIKTELQNSIKKMYADKYRVIQVIYNLLGNAVKFTPPGGSIEVSLYENGKSIFITVKDTGIGIPEDRMEDIFQPFEQVDADITRKYGGMGLGLGISKKIAEAHGGDICVNSILNKGSEFIFSIPKDESNHKEAYEDARQFESTFDMKKRSLSELTFEGGDKQTIVVIDDNYSNLVGTAGILKSEGYCIKGFIDPYAGIQEIFSNKDTVLAVVDLMMPGISGYELCSKIRERYSIYELPILVLTARTQVDSLILSLKEGANDILNKPYDSEELKARVNTLCKLKAITETSINNEMAMLQAQINPHFLCNAMNAVAVCCYEDGEKAAEAVLTLSDYFRYSFDLDLHTSEIPLSQEIELVKTYLSIEKMRFDERLHYHIDIDEGTGVLVPPFTIQTIVENAVRHGISKCETGGLIEIIGRKEKETYQISVQDNGAGMNRIELENVLSGDTAEGKGVGLKNVRRRLKKLYGTDLWISSRKGSGTTIIITIKSQE